MITYIPVGVALGSFILAAFAAWKAHKADDDSASAGLVEAEARARELLATSMYREVSRCHERCEQLQNKVEELEETVDKFAKENRNLRSKLERAANENA